MKKKSIEYLNSLWWYRLIKVLHILLWTLIVIGTVLGVFFAIFIEQERVDIEKSMIVCSDKSKSFNFRYLEIESAYNQRYWRETDLTREERTRIELVCEIDRDTVYSNLNKLIENWSDFDISVKHKTSLADTALAVFSSFLALLLVLFFESIVRHTFYYVVLGRLFPSKK